MKYELINIAEAIKKAVAHAQQFATVDDGGTCNFDSAYLCVPGMRNRQADDIEALCGFALSLNSYRYHGRILQIIGGRSGQGARQTKMAEAMRDSLRDSGYQVGMWYQMD